MEEALFACLRVFAEAFPVAFKAIFNNTQKMKELMDAAKDAVPEPLDFTAEDALRRRRLEKVDESD
tara:strand:+ start:5170 stop:5367 length:198 start_codon:yes stop_codon:yes gene_type:complete